MSFYEFYQNNSGGRLYVDDKLCHRLYIEADSYEQARKMAVSFGVYFDGCESGIDCDCCGDRWHDREHKVEFPKEEVMDVYTLDFFDKPKDYKKEWFDKYGKYKRMDEPKEYESKYSRSSKFGTKIMFENIEEYAQHIADEYGYSGDDENAPDSRIFYKDGSVKEIFTK